MKKDNCCECNSSIGFWLFLIAIVVMSALKN